MVRQEGLNVKCRNFYLRYLRLVTKEKIKCAFFLFHLRKMWQMGRNNCPLPISSTYEWWERFLETTSHWAIKASFKKPYISASYIPVENFVETIENMILSDSFDKNGNFKEALNMHIKEAVEKVIFFLLHRLTRVK